MSGLAARALAARQSAPPWVTSPVRSAAPSAIGNQAILRELRRKCASCEDGEESVVRPFRLRRALDEISAAAQAQLDCVVRNGGCPSSRDGGVPSPDDIKTYNKQCTAETRYSGPDITPDEEDCTTPTEDGCKKREADCRATAAYAALDAPSKKIADDIIATLASRSLKERFHRLGKLKLLFDTPVKSAATISSETTASTQVAATQEQTRLAKPAEAANKDIEEKGSADAARKWTKKPGKFGGNFWVDNSSPAHIFVKAEVYLHPTGTGKADDVAGIKSMEDAIEKAASAPGYSVDIVFVDNADADAFNVEVDPSRWEVATNWSGGDPLGFAHELHHLMAFELDKYNYIDAHATNQSMVVSQRLIWFQKEISKPAGYNDPTSIMDQAAHPNDVDACTVAGLDPATCVPARQKSRAP